MAREYSLVPRAVPRVETPFRKIVTELPVPASLPILERLHTCEPVAMRGQPPIVWHRAEGFQVFDPYGNQWVDWSSGVLIANAGHSRQEIVDAVEYFYGRYYFRPKVIYRIIRRAIFDSNDRRRLYNEARDYLRLRARRKIFTGNVFEKTR